MEQTKQLLDLLHVRGYENILTDANGLVLRYTDAQDELAAIQHGLSCREVSTKTQLVLQGNDALDFIHRISTNDLKGLQPKSIKRTLFTNEKGRLLESVLAAHLGDRVLLLGNENKSKLLQFWLKRFIIADDVVVVNTANEYALLEFRGEEIAALFILLFGDGAKNLKFDTVTQVEFNLAPVWLIPDFSTDVDKKFFLWAKKSVVLEVITECLEKGNMFGLVMVGEEAYTQFRIERAILTGNEIDDRFNPHEAELLSHVCFTKGCYIGQEVIARIDTYQKVQKHLRSFVFPETSNGSGMFTLLDTNKEEIGTITSTVYSSNLKKSIGIGFVKKEFSGENEKLTAVNENIQYPVIVKLPGKLHEDLY